MDNSDYIGELRRRLSPVVFSSALRSESGVELRVAALTEDDEINLLIEAEERGVALTIQVVGFSLADQRDLMQEIRDLKRREPDLGIDDVTVHFDGRVWFASRGPRPRLVERLRELAAPDRWHLHDLTAPTTYVED